MTRAAAGRPSRALVATRLCLKLIGFGFAVGAIYVAWRCIMTVYHLPTSSGVHAILSLYAVGGALLVLGPLLAVGFALYSTDGRDGFRFISWHESSSVFAPSAVGLGAFVLAALEANRGGRAFDGRIVATEMRDVVTLLVARAIAERKAVRIVSPLTRGRERVLLRTGFERKPVPRIAGWFGAYLNFAPLALMRFCTRARTPFRLVPQEFLFDARAGGDPSTSSNSSHGPEK